MKSGKLTGKVQDEKIDKSEFGLNKKAQNKQTHSSFIPFCLCGKKKREREKTRRKPLAKTALTWDPFFGEKMIKKARPDLLEQSRQKTTKKRTRNVNKRRQMVKFGFSCRFFGTQNKTMNSSVGRSADCWIEPMNEVVEEKRAVVDSRMTGREKASWQMKDRKTPKKEENLANRKSKGKRARV